MQDTPSEVSPRALIAAFALLAVAIIGGIVLLLSTRPTPVEIIILSPQPTATPQPTSTSAPITVYVTGAVAAPEQMVMLPYDSRVQDAINAAGGATDSADLTRVNLAALLRDGDQVHVPEQNAEPVALATPSDTRVRVNSATLEELMALPDIGQTTAQAILDYREANGAFTSMADLDAVTGIGPRTLEQLEGLVSFE